VRQTRHPGRTAGGRGSARAIFAVELINTGVEFPSIDAKPLISSQIIAFLNIMLP
jgi:hypothetical protein